LFNTPNLNIKFVKNQSDIELENDFPKFGKNPRYCPLQGQFNTS